MAIAGVEARDRKEPRLLARGTRHLPPGTERRMREAQMRELAHREVERMRRLEVIRGAPRGGAEPRLLRIFCDPRGEHVLPRARIAVIADEALLIAVVEGWHATQRQQQCVGEQHTLELLAGLDVRPG